MKQRAVAALCLVVFAATTGLACGSSTNPGSGGGGATTTTASGTTSSGTGAGCATTPTFTEVIGGPLSGCGPDCEVPGSGVAS